MSGHTKSIVHLQQSARLLANLPPVHVAEQELVDGQLLRGVQEVVPEGSLHRASSVSQLRGKRRE